MNQSAEKMFEELPGRINFATPCDAKLDLGRDSPPLNIKCERQSFPILLDCVKEETLIENDEQYLKPLFSNYLLSHKINEVKKEDQTPLFPFVPNVKVEVGDCNSVTTQLIIGQENQMKVENITNWPQCKSSNNLMEGDDELCSLKLSYEGPKAKYIIQSANIAIQSSDEINTCKVTEDDSEEVQENLEKDTHGNSNKFVQHHSEKDVQDGAKIVQMDHTSQDEDEGNCYYCGTTCLSRWHSECRRLFVGGISDAPFSCNFCLMKFKGKRSLTDHKRTHTGYSVVCDICGVLLVGRYALKSHRLTHTNNKLHKCSTCFKSFHSSYYLLQHMDIHTGQAKRFLCHICGQVYSKSMFYPQMKMHSNIKMYICDQCGKSFTRSTHLNTHLMKHSSCINYNCALCNKGTKTRTYLMHHIKTKHPETMGLLETMGLSKKFSCSICSKKISTKGNLKLHMQKHGGEKNYQCTFCSKRLTTKTGLTTHMQIHKGEKNYQCTICHKSFLLNCHLKKHSIFHTRERNYKCDLCDKTYMYPYDLSQHKKSVHSKKKTSKQK